MEHGGAGGRDELFTHCLQPPVNLGKYNKDGIVDVMIYLFSGISQLFLNSRARVEEKFKKSIVR